MARRLSADSAVAAGQLDRQRAVAFDHDLRVAVDLRTLDVQDRGRDSRRRDLDLVGDRLLRRLAPRLRLPRVDERAEIAALEGAGAPFGRARCRIAEPEAVGHRVDL